MRKGNIVSLAKMTEKLPVLEEFVLNPDGDHVEYVNDEGSSGIGFGLWKEKAVAVQRAYLPKGHVFPKHVHSSTEFLVVYKGKLVVLKAEDGVSDEDAVAKDIVLGIGDCIRLSSHTIHSVEALEDTWVIGVVVPDDKGYPNARQGA